MFHLKFKPLKILKTFLRTVCFFWYGTAQLLSEKFKTCYRLVGYNLMRGEWLSSKELRFLVRFIGMRYENEELRRTFLFSFCHTTKISKFSGNPWRNCTWSWGSVVKSSRGREIFPSQSWPWAGGVCPPRDTSSGPQRWFPRPKTICRCWHQSADGKTGTGLGRGGKWFLPNHNIT